ncbi:TonB-dependent receptor [Sphingomonas sp. 28-63-12]|uniref:TonB-dependent receptor n=1 Tax=Sphingomonas sp. 28-63-12 TaxID=1970434 RepID=UPI0035A94B9E
MLAVATTPAFAAEPVAAAAQEAAQADATDDGLPPITVTATRRAELSKDVPIAVTALNGPTLDQLNSSGLDIRFLSGRTPSLNIESSFGRTFPRFYIRGLGNTDFDPNAAQPVSVVYDDVALESPFLKSFPVFDLANVEVLRGPQGTLFGRNTPAGVVKLSSAKPGDIWSGYGSVSYATYNTVNAEAGIGGPLGGGFSFRASGLLQHRDNWVTNTSTTGNAARKLEGYTDLAGRFQLAYSSGDFNALINVHGRNLDGTPRVFRAGLIQQGSNNFSAGFRPDQVALDGYTSQALTQWGTNLKLDYHVDGVGTFYSVTAYEKARVESTGDIDGGNTYGFPPLGLNRSLFPVNTGGLTRPEEFSQELRFASDEFGGFRAQGGLYYFNQKLNYDEFNYNFPTTGSRAADRNSYIAHNNSNENYGIFASVEYKATDKLTLRAGGRYSHDSRNDLITDRTPGGSGIVFGLALPIRTRTSDGDFTWDVSGSYALNDAVNFYARVATGYQGPAIQDRVTFGSVPVVAPKQTTISGEAGFKGVTPDRTLRFAIDGYYWSTDNLQITAVGGASNSTRLLSAANAVGYGVEAEIEARPVPALTLTVSGSYNFTELRDPTIGVAPCGSGVCTPTDPVVGGLARINGNDLPQAPRFVVNWTGRYAVPVGDGEVYFFTDWAYRSSINYFLYEALEFRGRPLLEGGLKLGYKVNPKLDFGVYVRNVTNQIRSTSAIDFNNLTGFINDPRIVGGQVRVSF